MASELEDNYLAFVERRNAMLDAINAETLSYTHRLSAWMIAQLFVANAGGLTIGADDASKEALALFVVGLVGAMACSLAAWRQSHLSFHEVWRLGSPEAYYGPEHMPVNDPKEDKRQARWFAGALVMGIISLGCFAFGAFLRIYG